MVRKHGQRYCCLYFLNQACSSGYQTRHGAGTRFFNRLMAVSHLFISGYDNIWLGEKQTTFIPLTCCCASFLSNEAEMLTRIVRYSGLNRRVTLYRNCSISVIRSSSEIDDLSNEREVRQSGGTVIDARLKVELHARKKPKVTGKDIEEKIQFNSVIESLVDRSPFIERLERMKRTECRKARENKDMILDKSVDSIAASILSGELKSSSPEFSNTDVNSTPDIIFPYNSFTPINKRYELLKKLWHETVESTTSEHFNYGTADPNIPISTVPCGGNFSSLISIYN